MFHSSLRFMISCLLMWGFVSGCVMSEAAPPQAPPTIPDHPQPMARPAQAPPIEVQRPVFRSRLEYRQGWGWVTVWEQIESAPPAPKVTHSASLLTATGGVVQRPFQLQFTRDTHAQIAKDRNTSSQVGTVTDRTPTVATLAARHGVTNVPDRVTRVPCVTG